MIQALARNWRFIVLRGLAGLVFGLLVLFSPAIGLAALIVLFGAYALVDGVFAMVSAIVHRRDERGWGALLLGGAVGVAIGIFTILMPNVTALVLLYLIAAWAVVTGVVEIAAAVRLRKVITGEWALMAAGLLSVVVGVVLSLFPGAGALAVTLWIGAYAFVLGLMLVALGVRLRGWLRRHEAVAA